MPVLTELTLSAARSARIESTSIDVYNLLHLHIYDHDFFLFRFSDVVL